jgi:hypothetical protein
MDERSAPLLRQKSGARWPADLASGPALLVPFTVAVLLGSRVPLAVEVALLAAVVAAVGWSSNAPAGLVAVGTAVLSLNGFRENGLGVLHAYPRVDVPVTVTLLCVWAVVWAVGDATGAGVRSHP